MKRVERLLVRDDETRRKIDRALNRIRFAADRIEEEVASFSTLEYDQVDQVVDAIRTIDVRTERADLIAIARFYAPQFPPCCACGRVIAELWQFPPGTEGDMHAYCTRCATERGVLDQCQGAEPKDHVAALMRVLHLITDPQRCRDCGLRWDGNGLEPTACHPERGHEWYLDRVEPFDSTGDGVALPFIREPQPPGAPCAWVELSTGRRCILAGGHPPGEKTAGGHVFGPKEKGERMSLKLNEKTRAMVLDMFEKGWNSVDNAARDETAIAEELVRRYDAAADKLTFMRGLVSDVSSAREIARESLIKIVMAQGSPMDRLGEMLRIAKLTIVALGDNPIDRDVARAELRRG